MKFLLATLAAIAVQPLWLAVWLGASTLMEGRAVFEAPAIVAFARLAVTAMIVAAPFVLLVGLPSALLLHHARRRGAWLALIGFAVAALPLTGSVTWGHAGAWRHLMSLLPMVVAGLHGLFGAMAFHAVLGRPARGAPASTRT